MLLGIPATAKFHPARDFFPTPSMQGPTSFHTLMAYVGFMQDEIMGTSPGPETLSHKLEAIKLINGRLSTGSFDDSTISAVNLL
jgi:hypothetical protein